MAVLTHTYTRTHTVTQFADPYKKCLKCGNWIDGALDAPGPLVLSPCEHQSDYRDVCPISHEMRPQTTDDGKVY